jgi:predicted flap endonuclease-1-like 5' DNA nuclease
MTGESDGTAPKLLLKDRPATLGGKRVILRFAMIAMLALKERWKIEDDAPLFARIGKERFTDTPALIWACLQTHHPEWTLEEVTRFCDDAPAEEVLAVKETVRECVVAGYSTTAKKKPDAAPARAEKSKP